MHIDFFLSRDDNTHCPSGKSFFSCGVNDFRGCCSQDPCTLLSCPDDMPAMKDPGGSLDGHDSNADASSTMATAAQKKAPTPRSMTDSGTTKTIPNNSRITVTRHTTIVTDRMPSRTPSSADSAATSSGLASGAASSLATSGATGALPPAATSGMDSSESSGNPLSTGAIVGLSIGSIVVLAIVGALVFTFWRRRRERIAEEGGAARWEEEKNHPQSMSAHTTGTQGSSDPFAPFGGRADQPEDPYKPPSNTYEMDATSTAPVELPAISVGASHRQPEPSPYRQDPARQYPVQEAGPADPRANLNASANERRQNAYVNHWNQYRNLGQEGG